MLMLIKEAILIWLMTSHLAQVIISAVLLLSICNMINCKDLQAGRKNLIKPSILMILMVLKVPTRVVLGTTNITILKEVDLA